MIIICQKFDIQVIYDIINDAAQAYRGVIPEDCFQDPYMPMDELVSEIEDGVEFWGYEEDGKLVGVMGIQHVRDVTLIRHAYVGTNRCRQGIGGLLLAELRPRASGSILIGTWRDASWAIRFYEKHGFTPLPPAESARLLRRYWKISDRQIETSLVLAEDKWFHE